MLDILIFLCVLVFRKAEVIYGSGESERAFTLNGYVGNCMFQERTGRDL